MEDGGEEFGRGIKSNYGVFAYDYKTLHETRFFVVYKSRGL